MPEKVEAYECNVCRAVIIGTYDQVIAHEEVPKDEPLPEGLVYTETEECYYLITKCEFDMRRNQVVREDYDSNGFHGYIFNELTFMKTGNRNRLSFVNNSPNNSKSFRDFLKRKIYRLLDDKEFEKFKRLCRREDSDFRRSHLTLEQLTNKL